MPHSAESARFERILFRNVAMPLALGVVSALLFVGLVLYLLSSIRDVERTDKALSHAYAVQNLDLEMEASLRGFLIAGQEAFLQPFNEAGASLPEQMEQLRALSREVPVQLSTLQRIENLQGAWRTYAERHIARKRANGAYDIGQSVEEGRQMKASIRQEFNRFVAQEQRMRQEHVESVNRNTYGVLLGFAAFMLLAGIVIAWRGRADLRRLSEDFRGALEAAAAQLAVVESQNWLSAGQSALGERLAAQQNLDEIGRASLDFLADYLHASVGTLYVQAAPGWRRVATLGWSRELEHQRAQLADGETLLAECARRGQPVLMEDLPPGYLRVSSSLGESDCRAILMAPLVYQHRFAGVVELGFLQPISSRDRELVERIGGVVASSIEAALASERLQLALEETQQLNEELQVQQEELRTTNEELEEHARALRESQAQLESQQAELEQTNVQLTEFASQLENQRDQLREKQAQLSERAEELAKASRYKSEFLANMSHELRTPLNSQLILARLLAENRRGTLDAEEVQYAESIYSAGNDLLNLINDILDIAKVEAGRLEVRPETVPLQAVAEGLRSMFLPLADRKGIALEVEVAPGTPQSIYTDRQRLDQVLRNLLANAVKFTDKGEVSLHVDAPAAGQLRFIVRDTGIGIDPSQHAAVFEAFRQADGTTSRKYGGTGLGLSIARDLARLLGGDIALRSAPGEGSSFTLTLPAQYTSQPSAQEEAGREPEPPRPPVRAAAQGAAGPARAPAAAAPLSHEAADEDDAHFEDDRNVPREGRRCVLVIEDDPAFARILFDLAHELGYLCLMAARAETGFQLALGHLPDAVLLDMRLPDQSGLTVLQRLKEHAATRHIPVHALSAEDLTETALEMGAVGYVLKPVSREQLEVVFERLQDKLSQRVKRVLLVEDDARQADSVMKLIGDQDVEIVSVGEGAKALEALANSVFDCMIIDLSLPDMSGDELLRRMASGESRSFPPVIVYTGRNLTRDEEAQLRRYSRSIIIKGARSPERLLDEVTLFLHKVEKDMSSDRQKMLRAARSRDRALEGRRILVVDDDVRNIFALTSALEHKGAAVEVARNGREALEKLDAVADVDLVLMDIMMPEMDGYTAMREIRKQARWQKLPIIAVTAKAMRDDQERCLAAGANDYLAKPIDLHRLFSLMRVWMPKMERM